ncbi:hypothetical protein [Methylobacterium nigriterrae]|uniref:hypothetical protein n=1 Tax=Methylobacterium nigriterrae TaxID=3127512 RepID=UPI003013A93E
MSRRILCLLALFCVADAITVHGRGPRPTQITQPDPAESARLSRQPRLLAG